MPSLDKQVTFQSVEILEFHYMLGDNPSVTSGCPLALDVDLVQNYQLNVEEYEECRGKRKTRNKLIIPVHIRAQILMARGYSIDEIADGTIEADKARLQRQLSNNNQKWDKVNAISERFGRVFRRRSLPPMMSTAATTA